MILQRRVDGCIRLLCRSRTRLRLVLRLLLHLLRHGRCWLTQASTQIVQVVKQHVDLILERCDMGRHVLVFLRVLEAIAAVGRVDAFEVQVAASLTRCLAVALDLAALALVAT